MAASRLEGGVPAQKERKGRKRKRSAITNIREFEAATLESPQGPVVLEGVTIDGAIDDLMAIVTVCQRYRNPGTKHIETVYTFPLPVEPNS